ncbi:MAG: 50S ribosomal protein L11 methyltransferase [Psychrilyobacter sp.]|uniref:50S ribosomal protein L11 methyltransferase n=1 Tax=Psychrilyobacter sp. TaxID=2586924 RepID=UPI003C72D476
MKLIEVRLIFEADKPQYVKKEITDLFYEFGVQGLKIDEPMERNSLDYYRDEKIFLQRDYAVSAYFPINLYAEKKKSLILETFEEKFSEREDLIYSLDFYELDEEDYQNSWKKYLYPEKVSERFVVKPTWREYEIEGDEIVIELDPGRAFGTGSHPTTSLCIKQMEEYICEGDSIIDVGTGSGILMVAANKLGASEVWGVDIDPLAVEVAKENLELNKVDMNSIKLFKGDLVKVVEEKKFDVVVANILADVILLLLNDMSTVVKKGGIMILSGIIEDKADEIKRRIISLGYEVISEKKDKEWVSFSARA